MDREAEAQLARPVRNVDMEILSAAEGRVSSDFGSNDSRSHTSTFEHPYPAIALCYSLGDGAPETANNISGFLRLHRVSFGEAPRRDGVDDGSSCRVLLDLVGS